ncbi:MAG: tRNA (adenosine(37)-N6)-dimethylallyltransferase MiaA [Candidatus Yanofskybacteria bacterium RIFCSPHIGHO2_02_FULL_38_22b]|uniref:tRNA dimethylallyltransferase n=1 Tax=Candidatus Yanofskybacteria bacterium RIFCSPHIGHO2_02_FULL_38_22b TaxID=1802673 RepID=A0A1F8EZB6_9BACT|nr:MAG: tRNA (adenosine(37)-N6)-dimethylallyltransferase MiaA [Candidatus Yanofskybacteria bacterium RIFCSPHIGHO2_01_FULL_39_44]OGN06212.1 MAG: tRNA (adenosine(37)-N6)-dimethylallyltransferase MiaA [Candidatus Yanofskybacteria bacterium RIFCSPHIGHO2_02_FULL_38_22b]OGN19631.1 MAG: tRNA (adenosine(37)-N6)-dimethylallyltransferase MiaA [Candidatus Yanofskybacteria bacterium RIFCSPLOWO2_01_FULL_39_28]
MTKVSSASRWTKIIVIVGPTASGKSDLAIKLARKYHGEIISADSRQVYLGMNIGTGKVTKKEQKIVKHYLLDAVSPKKQFTADAFKKLGEKASQEITAKHKIPIIVGGTGFYIDILLDRMAVAEVPPNKNIRTKLEKQSAEQLFKQLQKLDPRRAKNIDKHNKRRLVRSLEIVLITGKLVPPKQTYNIQHTTYNILWIGLRSKNLEKRIKIRLDKRLSQGMIREVERLHQQGVSWKRLDDFGLEYRWISRYLQKVGSRKLKVERFKDSEYYKELLRDIVRYSKRQMTWFKRNKEITWIKNEREATKLVKHFVL